MHILLWLQLIIQAQICAELATLKVKCGGGRCRNQFGNSGRRRKWRGRAVITAWSSEDMQVPAVTGCSMMLTSCRVKGSLPVSLQESSSKDGAETRQTAARILFCFPLSRLMSAFLTSLAFSFDREEEVKHFYWRISALFGFLWIQSKMVYVIVTFQSDIWISSFIKHGKMWKKTIVHFK